MVDENRNIWYNTINILKEEIKTKNEQITELINLVR
jgi:hypothetical protein